MIEVKILESATFMICDGHWKQENKGKIYKCAGIVDRHSESYHEQS